MSISKERLSWIKKYWQKVIFNDISKFCLLRSDGGEISDQSTKENHPRYQTPTVKHGGNNVTVWDCF